MTIAEWPPVLAGDEVLAGAILDRLLHAATVLNIEGRSYRLKELDAQLRAAGSSDACVGAASEPAGPTGGESFDPGPSGEQDAAEKTGGGDETSKF